MLSILAAAALVGCSSPQDPRADQEAPRELISWHVDTHASRFAAGLGSEGWEREAVRLPGLASDLHFEGNAGLIEHSDGIASLEGVLASAGRPSERWRLTLDFAGREDLAGADAQGPTPQAGPARRTYALASGELVGMGAYRGARIRLLSDFPALHLGAGADGFGSGEGALCSLFLQVTSQPTEGPELGMEETPAVLRLRLTRATEPAAKESEAPPADERVALLRR